MNQTYEWKEELEKEKRLLGIVVVALKRRATHLKADAQDYIYILLLKALHDIRYLLANL